MSFKTLSLPGRFPLIVSFESKTTNPPKRYSYNFLHCRMNFDYLSGCRPNRCKQNWKDFLPGSPEGIHCPLQATSKSADCERSTLSFQVTINIYQPIHTSFALNTNLISLSIIVLFIPLHSYVKDSFLPIRPLLAKGKPPALQNFGTSSDESILDKVDALEPSSGILSGSSDRVSEAIGLVRDTWNDSLVLLGCGSLKKAEPKSGRS